MTALFIGVVSHAGTAFADSQGPSGLAGQLASRLGASGIEVQVVVSLEDAHDPATLPIDGALVRRSLDEQLRVERQWAAYLRAGRRRSPLEAGGSTVVMGLRWLKQTLAHVRPWHGADQVDASGARLIRRLINIELAHLALLRAGLESGADWILIAEDDAAAVDIDDCAAGLRSMLTSSATAARPSYINISQSFTPQELGIAHLLAPAPGAEWEGTCARAMLAASRPVTNTVCAILYRASFVRTLLPALEAIPIDPVIPIDWKLNLALMHLHRRGVLGPDDCWLVDPAPIDQRSMRGAA